MFIYKNFSARNIWNFTGVHIIWLTIWATIVTCAYEYFHADWLHIPWTPISVIGTAVAFYIGFKNNQAYDRMWEARKIWGGIINDSRTWGMMVDGYISNLFQEQKGNGTEIHQIKERLIYRHIAWLYAHRSQLLVATPWEHISQGGHIARTAEHYQKKYGIGLVDDEVTRTELKLFYLRKNTTVWSLM